MPGLGTLTPFTILLLWETAVPSSKQIIKELSGMQPVCKLQAVCTCILTGGLIKVQMHNSNHRLWGEDGWQALNHPFSYIR